jgi:hypothetical protein
MTGNGRSRAREGPGSRGPGSPTKSTHDIGGYWHDVVSTVTLSELLDINLALRLDAWRDGYRVGTEHGRAAGRAEAEAGMAASWREITEPVAHPERYEAQRLRAAIAGERRDAGEHERAFVARAYNTSPAGRAGPQAAAVYIYPPPGARQ